MAGTEVRVEKGALVPATARAAKQLNERVKIGDVVLVELKKVRNPRFNALAHAIGGLCAQNIPAFEGMGSHEVLKRLQLESGISCDEKIAILPDGNEYMVRQSKSMAFDKMDEVEFNGMVMGLCAWVSARWWPTVTAEQVKAMAECWIE